MEGHFVQGLALHRQCPGWKVTVNARVRALSARRLGGSCSDSVRALSLEPSSSAATWTTAAFSGITLRLNLPAVHDLDSCFQSYKPINFSNQGFCPEPSPRSIPWGPSVWRERRAPGWKVSRGRERRAPGKNRLAVRFLATSA